MEAQSICLGFPAPRIRFPSRNLLTHLPGSSRQKFVSRQTLVWNKPQNAIYLSRRRVLCCSSRSESESSPETKQSEKSSNNYIRAELSRGKSGSISFNGLTHQLVEESKVFSAPFEEEKGSLLWVLAPVVLISSLILPQLFLSGAIKASIKNDTLVEIVSSFCFETTFYAGVAIFLSVTDRVQRPYLEFSSKRWGLITGLRGYLVSSALLLGLKFLVPLSALCMTWQALKLNALIAVLPFLVGCVVQRLFEAQLERRGSSCWPIVPILFEVYRLFQVTRAATFVQRLMFVMKGNMEFTERGVSLVAYTDLLNLNLSDTKKIIAEYIWIGGSGMDIRSKARTLPGPVSDPSKLPKWNYDGSSTNQAAGDDSEVILYPQAIFKDPFRKGDNILVMCDAYTPAGNPIPTNNRHKAVKIFDNPKVAPEEPWFGIEQEYTLLKKDVKWPLGWPLGGFPGPQGPYYCAVGAGKAFGRDIVDAHYKACLYAGLSIGGANGEVMPGQWEFQISPVVGIGAGDQLWVARYILERITEICGVIVSFDPKPIEGDWNGAAAHTNFSTKSMRKDGGFDLIKKAIEKLKVKHKEHIAAYGEGNERRLTGKHETADINTFSWGVADRGVSVRVGRDTEKEGKGYFEDRRPSSNMDPYLVTSLIAETTILG